MSQSKPSGLSAAFGHELKRNGVSNFLDPIWQNTVQYLRIEALSQLETVRHLPFGGRNGTELTDLIAEAAPGTEGFFNDGNPLPLLSICGDRHIP